MLGAVRWMLFCYFRQDQCIAMIVWKHVSFLLSYHTLLYRRPGHDSMLCTHSWGIFHIPECKCSCFKECLVNEHAVLHDGVSFSFMLRTSLLILGTPPKQKPPCVWPSSKQSASIGSQLERGFDWKNVLWWYYSSVCVAHFLRRTLLLTTQWIYLAVW